MTTVTRQQEIQQIRKNYPTMFPIAFSIVILLIGMWLGSFLFQGDDGGFSYTTNLYTEIMSIAITVLVIEQLNRRRAKNEQEERDQQQREEQRTRDQLQREEQRTRDQLQSISDLHRANTKEERQPIIDRMGKGKLFRGADLGQADLSEANLQKADLEGAILVGVELEGAYLWEVNLKGAILEYAILVNAILVKANLEGAYLRDANLEAAILVDANLEGASLVNANLEGAILANTNLENIIWEGEDRFGLPVVPTLPDGEEWTSDTDMKRFTDREHSEYKATGEKINTIRETMGLGSYHS